MGARRAVWRSGVAAVLAAASVGPMASGAAATEYSQYCYYIEGWQGIAVPVPPPAERDMSPSAERPGVVFDVVERPAPDVVPDNPQSRGNKYWCREDQDDADDAAGQGDLVGMAATPSALGYWTTDRDGRVVETGDAKNLGALSHLSLAGPVVDIESTGGDGFWLAAADGGVFAFGSERFFGSASGLSLAGEITGMAARPQGDGYWLVGTDGGVFSFGGAPFLGSAARLPLRAPVVEIEPAPDGEGYWLVAADGGVFAFGSARFAGAPAGSSMAAPIADLAATGLDGYVLLGRDGGVFAYGSARFHGSSLHMFHNAAAIEATGDPYGYWVLHGGATG